MKKSTLHFKTLFIFLLSTILFENGYAQAGITYSVPGVTNAGSYLQLKNGTGFWHLNGPRTDAGQDKTFSIYWNNNTSYSAPYFSITAAGSVGLGTERPTSRLHVMGRIFSDAVDGGLWLGNAKDALVGNNGANFGFYTNAKGWNTFNINKTTGNVGIGTSTPDAKLTVAGNIKAREVEVRITAGADFVFEDDYQLPNLKDVETFVKTNKHLPGIQSEKDMQENGLNLNEMNIRLLQKVEELTLYIIDLEKRVNKVEQSK